MNDITNPTEYGIQYSLYITSAYTLSGLFNVYISLVLCRILGYIKSHKDIKFTMLTIYVPELNWVSACAYILEM